HEPKSEIRNLTVLSRRRALVRRSGQVGPRRGRSRSRPDSVSMVLIDDEGFGAASMFGGEIPTPTSDSSLKKGLRHTNFHTTSPCSPTRAASPTGRNHGAVWFEMVAEISTGFPGSNATIGKESVASHHLGRLQTDLPR